MDIQQHIKNLNNYLKYDITFNNPKSIESDFDRFCYNHCRDIEVVLSELDKKDKIINAMSEYLIGFVVSDKEEVEKILNTKDEVIEYYSKKASEEI